MRYAIISDIHSNLESLKEFLVILPGLGIEKIICLGDVVGYNPNPNECISLLSQIKSIEMIRGNHDRALLSKNFYDFSYNASVAIKWTMKNINKMSFQFLKKLKKGPKIIDNLFGICHGSVLDEDNYLLSAFYTRDDFAWLKKNKIKILFFGHTHYQKIYCLKPDNKIKEIKDKNLSLDIQCYYLINPGSIGQPRDNDARASFVIFDSDEMRIDVIRYEYPYHLTQQKILKQNLPQLLALRLAVGK